tara:strand:+ start:168 stop:317 length:150 start_codon:yes stop_codon:yes gene_type:complete
MKRKENSKERVGSNPTRMEIKSSSLEKCYLKAINNYGRVEINHLLWIKK